METLSTYKMWVGLPVSHRKGFLLQLTSWKPDTAADRAAFLRLLEQKGPNISNEKFLKHWNAYCEAQAHEMQLGKDFVRRSNANKGRFTQDWLASMCKETCVQIEAYQAIEPLLATAFYQKLKKRSRTWVLEDFLQYLKAKHGNSAKQLSRLAKQIHDLFVQNKSTEADGKLAKGEFERGEYAAVQALLKSLDKELGLFLLQHKLRNTDLCKLMGLLKPAEYPEFLWWVQRPSYGKRSSELQKLAELILEKIVSGPGIDAQALYRLWQTDKPARDRHAKSKLKASMAALEKALEDYLALKENERTEPRQSIALLRSLNQRNGTEHFEKYFVKATEALEPGCESYYELRYALEECKVRHDMCVPDRLQKSTYADVIRYASEHAIVLQTRLVCDALMHRLVTRKELDLAPMRLLPLLPQLGGQLPVLSQAFQKAWLMLENPQQKSYLEDLIQLLQKEKGQFGHDDLRRLYKFALNVCIAQINLSRMDYSAVLDQIFEDTLPNGLLLQDGVIECSYLRNIVVANARKGNIQAARKFYGEYHDKIAQVNDPCTPQYLAAIIQYYDQPSGEGLRELLDKFHEFAEITDDEYYKLDAWAFRMRIAVDLQDWEKVVKLANNFRGHLRGCKSISAQQLEKYHHFRRYIARFAEYQLCLQVSQSVSSARVHAATVRKVAKKFLGLWSEVVSNMHVVAHEWLKEKIEAVMGDKPLIPPQLSA